MRRRVAARAIGGALVALIALVALFALIAHTRAGSTQPRPSAAGASRVQADVAGELGVGGRSRAAQAGARAARARRAREASTPDAHDALVFAGPGPDDPAGPGMLPHPLTAEHARMHRDVELLDGAWRALKGRDFERARELLQAHATEYASGYDDLHDGLSILADCMQSPTATSRERAARFYAEHTASSMRRRLRTHCLQAR